MLTWNNSSLGHRLIGFYDMTRNSAMGAPVIVKLRFGRERRRQSGDGFILVGEEADVEVLPNEGLEIFQFQVRFSTPPTPWITPL